MNRDIQSELVRVVSRSLAAEHTEFSAAQLRSAALCFIRAGRAAVQAAEDEGANWVCWGLRHSLPGPSEANELPIIGAPLEYEFARELRARLEEWRSEGLITSYFLMRKPPGLRLRLRSRSPASVRSFVETWLHSVLGEDAVQRASYEAEVYQFGGPTGMDIAHEHFTSDTAAMLDAVTSSQEGLAQSPELTSALCIFDLVSKVTGDNWEAWDLWKRMEFTGRLPGPERGERYDAIADRAAAWARPLLFRRAQVMERLPAPQAALVRRYEGENTRLSKQLREAADRAELLSGIRSIVPFWIVFHWNRWGFDTARQRFISLGAERALTPK